MKNDAVSPVVAFMLLLMIVVSFISVINAYYIPSLKQQAEIEHLKKVEEAFLILDSDIHRLISFKDNAETKVRIPLGGGDVPFSPIRSSGFIIISNEKELGELRIGGHAFDFSLANISYRPIGNFWINQGYHWGNGTVNVTKGNRTSTWLEYGQVEQAINTKQDFFNLLLKLSIDDKIVNSSSNILENVTLIVNEMTITPSRRYTSGNGYAVLSMNNSKTTTSISSPVNDITLCVNSTLTNEENDLVNNSFSNISIFDYKNTKDPVYNEDLFMHTFKFDPAINITIIENELNLEVI